MTKKAKLTDQQLAVVAAMQRGKKLILSDCYPLDWNERINAKMAIRLQKKGIIAPETQSNNITVFQLTQQWQQKSI